MAAAAAVTGRLFDVRELRRTISIVKASIATALTGTNGEGIMKHVLVMLVTGAVLCGAAAYAAGNASRPAVAEQRPPRAG